MNTIEINTTSASSDQSDDDSNVTELRQAVAESGSGEQPELLVQYPTLAPWMAQLNAYIRIKPGRWVLSHMGTLGEAPSDVLTDRLEDLLVTINSACLSRGICAAVYANRGFTEGIIDGYSLC